MNPAAPADRGPGRPWRPGTPPSAPIDPDLPSADICIGYARCSTLGQDLDSQLDALSKHGIPREKISTRVRVRPKFEEALRTAREVKAHAPHCRVIFTVYEMKRLGRDAAELTALADHLTAHGLVLKMLAGPLPGIYDPTGPGKLLFAFFAAMAETERENILRRQHLPGAHRTRQARGIPRGRRAGPRRLRRPGGARWRTAPSRVSRPRCGVRDRWPRMPGKMTPSVEQGPPPARGQCGEHADPGVLVVTRGAGVPPLCPCRGPAFFRRPVSSTTRTAPSSPRCSAAWARRSSRTTSASQRA
ncbi:recombinase family protein [Streptomyces sp. NPDC087218]|uniref:recombinase family protein n=1 Tax=Streptomyces sp. NPDC087218 TaxID=3365769 RepID=UPI0037F5E1AA